MIYEFNGNIVDGLYYFYASWNSKCNASMNRLERISNKFNITIIKVNTTKYPNMKKNFNIVRIPSYLYIKDNIVMSKMEGNIDYISLFKWIESL